MSKPTPGLYLITNDRDDPEGRRLYATYSTQYASITVQHLKTVLPITLPPTVDTSQLWVIADADNDTQTISPSNPLPDTSPDQQVTFGTADHTLATFPSNNCVWTITGSDTDGYTIVGTPPPSVTSSTGTVFWGLNFYIAGEAVSWGHPNALVQEQKWKLYAYKSS